MRVGFSLREVENTVLRESLFVFEVGIGVVLITGLLCALYFWMITRRQVQGSRRIEADPVIIHNGHHAPQFDGIQHDEKGVLDVGALSIDYLSKAVKRLGEPVELSPKEFELVSLLASSPGRVFSNQEILDSVWPDGYAATSKDVKQYIYLLRRKLEPDPENPSVIVTVRGFGYKLDASQEDGA